MVEKSMLDIAEYMESLPMGMLRKVGKDPVKTAALIDLEYVSDSFPGIARIRKGSGFSYVMGGKTVKDEKQLHRIHKLVIPPAWENVWICKLENGHLQVTGLDTVKRKQYRYHHSWNAFRNQTKYYRLHEFGRKLPALRSQIDKDLSLRGMTQEKVLATVVSLMERTTIRVGSPAYEKRYGSFGLTTLKDKHVAINGKNIKFTFKGKKGINHNISIGSKRLADIVKKCRDMPGKELFQYYDDCGIAHQIDSGMVNDYIRKSSGDDFTSKDLRTWVGSVQALHAFKKLGPAVSASDAKGRIVAALDQVSLILGNTRNVCRKYYVHPAILSLYEKNQLNNYLEQPDMMESDDDSTGLSPEEKMLMKILELNH
jgi:DNA topoisomerase-1